AEKGKDEQGDGGGLGEGKAQCRAHERSGAGAGDNCCENAGEKRVLQPAAAGCGLPQVHQPGTGGKKTGKTQTHNKKQVGEGDNKCRGLELESPAQGFAASAQNRQQQGDGDKGDNNAEGIGKTVNMTAVGRQLGACQAQHLDGQNR